MDTTKSDEKLTNTADSSADDSSKSESDNNKTSLFEKENNKNDKEKQNENEKKSDADNTSLFLPENKMNSLDKQTEFYNVMMKNMKDLMEANASQKEQIDLLKKRQREQDAKEEKNAKKDTEQIKKFFSKIIEDNPDEKIREQVKDLKPEIENMLKNFNSQAQAYYTPRQILSACASAYTANVNQLEKIYQEKKALEKQLKNQQNQNNSQNAGFFSDLTERVKGLKRSRHDNNNLSVEGSSSTTSNSNNNHDPFLTMFGNKIDENLVDEETKNSIPEVGLGLTGPLWSELTKK
jgi:DNA repair exonuclease SbcCD ATPase subunit